MQKRKYSLFYLFPYLARYRTNILVGFFMVVLTALASMVSPWVLKYVVDDLRTAFLRERLPFYAALIISASLVEGFFRFWMRRILIGISRDIEYDLRNDFLERLQRHSLSFFQSRNTGDIMSRATNDLNAVRSVLGPGIMYSMNTCVTALIAMTILLRINWRLTILACVPMALVSVIVKKFGQQIHDRFESIQEQFSAISTKAQESLSGIRVVKAFAREESEIEEFRRLNNEYVRRSISLIRLWGIFYPLMSALLGISTIALLWYGGRQVISGMLSLGEFVAFMGYLGMLIWPTIAAGWVINIFQRGTASMERMLEILEAEPDIRESPDASCPSPITGALEVRNLTFRYPNSSQPVLCDISLSLPAGETLAIVGHTGSGKSTLINLIPRLFDPPKGSIFIDGHDVRDWRLADLRKAIGYVPQETFLFSDTIAENIAFGFDKRSSMEPIERAAQISHIAQDIRGFPQQFSTFVGERGITLSGGQKQRVAISRAIAVQPKILILDDSLSNVDTYTEEEILQDLSDVMKNRTTILVSHRISTVRNAHQIVVLQEGKIVERGTHESLMALEGIYSDLYQKQLLEEELANA
ncbi:MAG TPA: ABC transporter ATP-binding protein [Acidobacteriota bacterium]|nr:ABC transporter ATP-binding protein [Acidobacteriota bacterium]